MKKASLLLILAFIITAVSAQTYKLDDVIKIGLENVLDYKLEKINSKYSRQQMNQSIIDLFPSVSASYNYGFSGEKSFFDLPRATTSMVTETVDSVLVRRRSGTIDAASMSYTISKSFSLNDQAIFGYFTSKNDLKKSGISEQDKKKNVVYNILTRYLSVIESQNALSIRQENLNLEEKVFQETKILYDTDRKTALDLKQAEISLIDAKINLSDQLNSYRKLREDLLHYVGLPVDSVYFVDPEVSTENTLPEYKESFSLKIAELNLKNRKLNCFQSKLSIVPSLSVSYTYGDREDFEKLGDFPGVSLTDGGFSIGLGISYNFTNSYRDITGHKYTASTMRHAEKQHEFDKKQEKLEYDQLLKDWYNLKKTYSLSGQKLKLAEDNLNMSQEKYNLGMLSMIDLDKARITYLNSRLSYNSTYYSLIKKYEEVNLHVSGLLLGKY